MLGLCHSINCTNHTSSNQDDFCEECQHHHLINTPSVETRRNSTPSYSENSLSAKYPKYYKPVGDLTEVDVYAVHKLFDVQDPSGAIHHASKKLLLSGIRTGGKSKYHDIKEARDTLTRWLQLFDDTQ